ncbi:MAG TPA: transposase [Candidatus Saccharimonadales bacterium]|nr:transposase [Candidatus Saccharimonadales bacterium]
MNPNNLQRERKRNRLQYYDYSQNGWYFITICTKNREEFFGKIKNDQMILNEIGEITKQCWIEIPNHFSNVVLDEFVIMPNHVHGIIVIRNVDNIIMGNKDVCSLQDGLWQTKLSGSLSSIVRGFKIGVTKWCHQNNVNNFLWQKSFYDHVIKDEKSLYNIRTYIHNNPLKWAMDKNNLENLYY